VCSLSLLNLISCLQNAKNTFNRLDLPMLLDNTSYVTSHDQLAGTVQRLGTRLDSTFVDGGIHPRFGNRNSTLPLQNGHYLEVVCLLDYPSSDSTCFGKAVSQRKASDGHRTKTDLKDLAWKQIGILGTLKDKQLPFFIERLSLDHSSTSRKAIAKIDEVEWAIESANDGESGIAVVHIMTPSSVARLD